DKYHLIDDSYNANPASMEAALNVLAKSPGRKIAVLGTMLELGEDAEKLHKRVGEKAGKVADVVIGVGDMAQNYHPTKIFPNSELAAQGIFTYIREGDSILVKGSRGVRMEKIVEGIVNHGI
ncbi:MAG: cyanophycin synthetase, partial [Patescibacteria group bacterium]